jgi:hypothetical protein
MQGNIQIVILFIKSKFHSVHSRNLGYCDLFRELIAMVRNALKVLKSGAREGLRRSVGPIV